MMRYLPNLTYFYLFVHNGRPQLKNFDSGQLNYNTSKINLLCNRVNKKNHPDAFNSLDFPVDSNISNNLLMNNLLMNCSSYKQNVLSTMFAHTKRNKTYYFKVITVLYE